MAVNDAHKSAQMMREDHSVIRKAYKAGKRKVMVRGKEMAIRKVKIARTVVMGGKLNTDYPEVKLSNTDVWLFTKPTDGSLLPRHCVEETPGKNGFGTRSK